VRLTPESLLVAAGLIGTVALAVGLGGASWSELRQQHSTSRARIVGVYRWDDSSKAAVGSPGLEFSQDSDIVAEVDWSAVPGDVVVSAEWYDSSGDLVDSIGPAPASKIGSDGVMWSSDNFGSDSYAFELERWSGGERVETLAREVVSLT
jgi:hypothetical protein